MKINAKYVVFSVIALMSLYVMYHNERFLVDSAHPAWQHYAPFKWWLLPHGIFGAIVLLLLHSSFPIGCDSDLPKRTESWDDSTLQVRYFSPRSVRTFSITRKAWVRRVRSPS
jgi:hypothetical protein